MMEEGKPPKYQYSEDAKCPNGLVVKINDENHTLGNLIKEQLDTEDHVIFAGYRIIHPLKKEMILRVRTDGVITPQQALQHALRHLGESFRHLENAISIAHRPGVDVSFPRTNS